MSENAISLRNLGKMYTLYNRPGDKVLDALGLAFAVPWRRKLWQEFWALRGLDLDIVKGQRLGIIGRNGAGKSTMLKLICGTLKATEGSVDVRGRIQALMELGTGFHPEFTARQNIRASLSYQGLASDLIRQKEAEILDFAELEDFAEQPVRTYSAGMYARLAFSTATAIEPEILIIDEVLGAGDAYFTGKCIERMERLTHDSGATVLFVSHDLASLQRLCPQCVWIDRGRVQRQGPTLDVIKEYAAIVRREEEVRLRARDMKVLKKQAVMLDRQEDVYDKVLMHLLPANGTPMTDKARIYGLRLLAGGEEVGKIAVGSAMDNSVDYPSYVMASPGFMDWGPPKRDAVGPYREYGDFGGQYGHAPFEFAVPKGLSGEGQPWTLEVTYASSCAFVAEVYDSKSYSRLGVLEAASHRTVALTFDPKLTGAVAKSAADSKPAFDGALSTASELNVGESSTYGTCEVQLTGVKLLDASDNEVRVVEMGAPLQVVMEFDARAELPNPVFVFCVYLSDGQCAAQWAVSGHELGATSVRGRGSVVFALPRLHLGKASYVASAAIFKRLRSDGQEAESYHVLDRCIHFQVQQSLGEAMSRGLCLQPFEAKLVTNDR